MSKKHQMLANLFHQYLEISPDNSAMALDNWRGKKFGKYLLDLEIKLLAENCAGLSGYRMMHLGVTGERCALEPFDQLHQFYVRPSCGELSLIAVQLWRPTKSCHCLLILSMWQFYSMR